jgi:hypothetical protein
MSYSKSKLPYWTDTGALQLARPSLLSGAQALLLLQVALHRSDAQAAAHNAQQRALGCPVLHLLTGNVVPPVCSGEETPQFVDKRILVADTVVGGLHDAELMQRVLYLGQKGPARQLQGLGVQHVRVRCVAGAQFLQL